MWIVAVSVKLKLQLKRVWLFCGMYRISFFSRLLSCT